MTFFRTVDTVGPGAPGTESHVCAIAFLCSLLCVRPSVPHEADDGSCWTHVHCQRQDSLGHVSTWAHAVGEVVSYKFNFI